MTLRTRPVIVLAVVAFAGAAIAQSIQRDSFDGREVQWAKGPANVPVNEEAHVLTGQHAHSLPSSEYIRVKTEANGELNPYVYYSYPTKSAPMAEDMTVRLWVRANRPNVALLARVVLPHERNPEKPGEPLTVMLRGESYTVTGAFWQPLEIRRPVKLLKDQQQLVRTRLNHDINIADAYVDRIILNLYAGPGVTEAWVDDLEIGPVIEDATVPKGQTPATTMSRSTVPPAGVTPAPAPNQGPTPPARRRGWPSNSVATSCTSAGGSGCSAACATVTRRSRYCGTRASTRFSSGRNWTRPLTTKRSGRGFGSCQACRPGRPTRKR